MLSSEAEEPEKADRSFVWIQKKEIDPEPKVLDLRAHPQQICRVTKRRSGMELLGSEEEKLLNPNCFTNKGASRTRKFLHPNDSAPLTRGFDSKIILTLKSEQEAGGQVLKGS